MSTIKINELATSSISLTDFLVKADQNGLATKNTMQGLQDFLSTLDDMSFKGSISAGTYASKDAGWYIASESGDYIMGSNTLTVASQNLGIIIVPTVINDSNLVSIPITISIDSTVTEGSSNAVSGNAVFEALENNKPIIKENDWYDPNFINPYSVRTIADGILNTTQDFAFIGNLLTYRPAIVDGFNCMQFSTANTGNTQLSPAFSKLFFNKLGYENGDTYKLGMWVKAPNATDVNVRTVNFNGFGTKVYNLENSDWTWVESNDYTVDADDWQDWYFSVRYFEATENFYFRGLTLVNTTNDELNGERTNSSFEKGQLKQFTNLYPFSQFIFGFNNALSSPSDQNGATITSREITTLTGEPIEGNGFKFTYPNNTEAAFNFFPLIGSRESTWGTFQSMLPQVKKDVWLQIGFWVKVTTTLPNFSVTFNNERFGGYGMQNIQSNFLPNQWYFVKSIPILLGKNDPKKIINNQIRIDTGAAPSDGSNIIIEIAGLTYGVNEDKFAFRNDYLNNLASSNRFYTKKWTTYGDSITAYTQYQHWASQKLGADVTVRAVGGSSCFNNGDIFWGTADGAYIDRPPSPPPAGTEGVDYFVYEASACTQSRINTIPADTEVLSFMFGMNDYGRVQNLGTINDAPTDALNTGTFYGYLKSMVLKAEARVPNAFKFFINITHRDDEASGSIYGLYMWQLRKAIRDVAELYGYPVVDVENINVNDTNTDTYVPDNIHPDWQMFRLIANRITSVLEGHQSYDFVKEI
jgi:hypothetical protein